MMPRGYTPHTKILYSRAEEFATLYPTMLNADIAAHFGVTIDCVNHYARRNKIWKSKEWRRYICRITRVGRKHRPESIEKMSAAKRGIPRSPETRAKMRATRKERYPRKNTQHNRYDNPRYLVWRMAVLTKDTFTCQVCGTLFPDTGKGLEAHHLQSYTRYTSLRYEVTNGIAVCPPCHETLDNVPRKELPLCACGCGQRKKTPYGLFCPGHNLKYAPPTGRKHSPEARHKMSIAQKGRTSPLKGKPSPKKGIPWTEKERENHTNRAKHKHSSETKIRMSAAQKRRFAETPTTTKGMKRTDEQRIRMSEAQKKSYADNPERAKNVGRAVIRRQLDKNTYSA